MSAFVLGKQDQARCIFVQAMHHTGPFLAADAFDLRVVTQHSVDQCAGGMTRGGMHHHPGGFIHNKQIVIFKNYVEGNLLSDDLGLRGRRDANRQCGAGIQRLTSLPCDSTVHVHASSRDQSLNPRTRKLRQRFDQIFIQPLARLFFKSKVKDSLTHLLLHEVCCDPPRPACSFLAARSCK